jgi:hypothetical protein
MPMMFVGELRIMDMSCGKSKRGVPEAALYLLN